MTPYTPTAASTSAMPPNVENIIPNNPYSQMLSERTLSSVSTLDTGMAGIGSPDLIPHRARDG